jgi:NADP-dependent 3-hydroxy acid dehydrogenase YdfG
VFLNNATVVILGGSSGMGLATAKAAEAEGARVVITGRSPERLQAARAVLGDKVRTVALDVGDEMGTRALFSELDTVDHVFITAGTARSIRSSRRTPSRSGRRSTRGSGAHSMPLSSQRPK